MSNQSSTEKWVVSIREAAQLCSVSEITIRRLIRGGTLPRVRVGRRVLVRIEDLRRLLEPVDKPATVQEVAQCLRELKNR